jgi:hypothetical protein
MTYQEFKVEINSAKSEEAVKAIYSKYFNIRYNTSNHHDLYTPQVFFEFKLDKNFNNLKALATVLAQTLYYIRRLKYEDTKKVIPPFICIADNNESIITDTVKWSNYYTNDTYNWDRAPSNPDSLLVDHLIKEPELSLLHVFKVTLQVEHNAFKKVIERCLNPQLKLGFPEKKNINEENFEAVFEHWKGIIGRYINNGYKLSDYFLSNLQEDRITVDEKNGKVFFTFEDNISKAQKILLKDYQYFWNLYEQVDNYDIINGINAKLDRLTDESTRRFEGEFYTPLIFAKKAVHYFADVLGKNWYKSGKYRIWDMASGTGNLEWHLPAEAYKYLYISTLHSSEVDHNKKVFRDATCFQYDYLNDDVEYLFLKNELQFQPNWKLPQKLRDDLKNEALIWIIFINPPFATAQVGGAKGENKKGVSKTKIEVQMTKEKIGHAKRELFAQFIYRIVKEIPNKAYLGMFSKLKYLNAPDSIEFRNDFFSYKFEKGFVFKSTTFHGVKGKYPIGFLIWNLTLRQNNKGKSIPLDILNNDSIAIGVKHLTLIEKKDVINLWFKRPHNSDDYPLPPLSNGITIASSNKDVRHRARPDFLASICSKGNDFQNSKYVSILSSPSVSAGAFTVTSDIFEKSLTLHAVRKIPNQNWLNDRNQFLSPRIEPNEAFTNDCVIWSLFSQSNETTSLANVIYENKIYQIKNNFFPFLLEDVKKWDIRDSDFKFQMSVDKNRFVSEWIQNNHLSEEAKLVLLKGKEVYKEFYSNLNLLPTNKFKIHTWDAGWYQIRRCLIESNIATDLINQVKVLNGRLAEKINPQIEFYGFLDKDEIYEKSGL